MPEPMGDKLWGIRELAAYLGYTESTLQSMVSKKPQGLPPRVAALSRPRWEPGIVRAWVAEQSAIRPRLQRAGRPRANR